MLFICTHPLPPSSTPFQAQHSNCNPRRCRLSADRPQNSPLDQRQWEEVEGRRHIQPTVQHDGGGFELEHVAWQGWMSWQAVLEEEWQGVTQDPSEHDPSLCAGHWWSHTSNPMSSSGPLTAKDIEGLEHPGKGNGGGEGPGAQFSWGVTKAAGVV